MVQRGFHASTSCHYLGLPEFESMAFLLHLLRPGDVFVDAGANIGAYSLLASKVCGAESLAFEPALDAADIFRQNIRINRLENLVKLHQVGLGASQRTSSLTTQHGIQNHVSTTGNPTESVEIQLQPLDDFCKNRPPVLIKMDVEGFETEVVRGASKTLANPDVKALILERMGLGKRFGFDEVALHQELLAFGFQLFEYQPFEQKLNSLQVPVFGNNLYLRDVGFIENRVKSAPKITVYGVQL